MKKKMIIAISALVIIGAAVFCFFGKDICTPDKCKTETKSDSKAAACNSCGKNSCDKSCSSNPNDTTNLKALVPSCNLSSKEMETRREFLLATISKKIGRVGKGDSRPHSLDGLELHNAVDSGDR